jgi:hypothetical protein
MVTGYIYALSCTCHDDGVRYVGQTTRSLSIRLGQHRRAAERGNNHAIVYKWMRRHSPANIRIELLQELPNCTQDELNAAESAWIAHFRGQKSNLLNMWAPWVDETALNAAKSAIPA